MKAINLVKTTIDIPFLDKEGNEALKLSFDRSDENIERLYSSLEELKERAATIDPTEGDITESKQFIKDTMDSMLGEGSFDKVYQLSPSLSIIGLYFYQIAVGIKEELESQKIEALEDKYIL